MSAPTRENPIPSASAVSPPVVGKQPLEVLLDLNHDGIPDYEQRWFRDTVSGALFHLIATLFPRSPWALVLQQYQAEIQAIIDRGAK